MQRRAIPLFVLALLSSSTLAPRPAQAEPQAHDPAAAQALFYSARNLMQQGRYTEACPKLEESMRLDAGIGTQFNLADCNEHIGKTATAWAGFIDVAAAARATRQTERENVARRRAQALEARVPKLVVEATATITGLEVARDGVPIAPSQYGTEVPVDPGVHRITATAPGKQTWETTVNSVEARTARVTVPTQLAAAATATVPDTARPHLPPPQPVASGAETTVTSGPTSFPPPVVEGGVSPQRAVGWILAGAGAIGVGVGAGFGLASIGARNDSREHCTGDLCDGDGVRLRDDAMRNGNIATISMIAGGVAVAGGLILVLTAPRGVESPERAGKLRAVPSLAREGGGLLLEGRFQ